jgi:hypothetical protein
MPSNIPILVRSLIEAEKNIRSFNAELDATCPEITEQCYKS